jgi:archaellum component FlaC
MQALRNQIKTLEDRVEALLAENQSLKADLNRFSEYTPKELSRLNGSMATSAVREVQL